MKKKIISLCTCVCLCVSIFAQGLISPAYYQGKELYDRLAYSEAIPYLLKECINKNNQFLDAVILLADCYRKTNQYQLAETEYKIIVQDKRLKDNNQFLYYAQVLQNNKKYSDASKWYGKYLESNPSDKRASYQMKACQNITPYLETDLPIKTTITNLPFNTNGYDFGTLIENNKLYYTSTGGKVKDAKSKDVNLWTGERFMNFYQVDIIENDSTSDEYSQATIVPGAVNAKYNEGSLCFNEDKSIVYFTRNQYNPEENSKLKFSKDKEANLSIYQATVKNNTWEDCKELPFNSKQYSCGHPTFDEKNQTLYFSSTMPGGHGASDIWKVKLNNGVWEKPINLGPTINTEGDEMFPSIANNTLYFSSDGLGGLGGLDIFEASIVDDNIQQPKNVAAPINSSYDDFSLLINNDKKSGFFSSNRIGGKGEDDIYRFSSVEYKLDVLVIDKFTKLPIATSQVVVMNGDEKNDLETNENGKTATEVNSNTNYTLMAAAPDYLPVNVDKYITSNEKKPNHQVTVELQPMVMAVKVINAQTKEIIEAAEIVGTASCKQSNLVALSNTDGNAYFYIKNNCTYSLTASRHGFFPKAPTQITTTLKDTTYVLIELELINDKPIALNNIYYDFNKWNIRKDAESDLKMLLSFIKINNDAIVELSSHTDARGDDEYNLELSQKRAQSAVDWLIANGVNSDNIKPVGYGETKPINDCVNNKQCSEEAHQKNRRTEFRVLNAGQVIASQNKTDIKISPCQNCPF